jgi:hypothetical protein
MRRPQFTLKTLLWLMLCVACFFGGIQFERERRRREDEKPILGITVEEWLKQPRPK